MIKIYKGENDYIGIEISDNKWIDSMVLWLTPKELEQLFKKVGKILQKDTRKVVPSKKKNYK